MRGEILFFVCVVNDGYFVINLLLGICANICYPSSVIFIGLQLLRGEENLFLEYFNNYLRG
jgi:hypothetical protein